MSIPAVPDTFSDRLTSTSLGNGRYGHEGHHADPTAGPRRSAETGLTHRSHQAVADVRAAQDRTRIPKGSVHRSGGRAHLLRGAFAVPGTTGAGVTARRLRAGPQDRR